ncbi:MAG: hypothetical protein ACI8R9_002289 [Paraglaciecola sp.]|jgi:hypothetical protein
MKTPRCIIVITQIVMLSTLGISGCSSDMAAAMRKVTYPPDFKYVSPDELRSSMQQLAYQLQQLDGVLMPDNLQNSAQQQKVVSILGNIERIGSRLQASDAGASHPFLQDFMQDFLAEIDRARSAASLAQPRYYLAGRVSGGCLNCHKVNR